MREGASSNQNRMSRSAWITLGVVVLMFIWGAGTTAFYFSLPTDGWYTNPPGSTDSSDYLYVQNLIGVPSGLMPGDRVVGIEGIELAGIKFNNQDFKIHQLSGRWQAGNTLQYIILRGKETQVVEVPLVHWSFQQGLKCLLLSEGNVSGILGLILFLAIGVLTFVKRPTDHAAQSLLLFAAMIFFLGSTILLYIRGLAVNIFPATTIFTLVTVTSAYTVLIPPTLLRFTLVFPHPKPFIQRNPHLEAAPYLIGLAIIPLFLLTNGLAGYAWTILTIIAAIVILIHNAFTMRDAFSRAQLLWGLWGVVLGLLMELSTFLVTFHLVRGFWASIVTALSNLSFGVLGVTLSIAILRFRLFDINVVIRRTLVYGALTLALGLAYFGSIVVLRQLLGGITSQSQISIVLSTLLIAVLFTPLRLWFQKGIDRRFYREKYDAAQALEEFSTIARDEVGLDEISQHLTVVVTQTVRPAHVSLWLRDFVPIGPTPKKDQG